MKKGILMAMTFACLSFGLFAGEPETTPTNEEVTTVTLTFAELKAAYGDNIDFDGILAEDATITLQKKLTPCDENLLPCGAALALAKQQLQQEANACCCILIYGVECCDPSTGSLYAVLFLVEPRDPACN